VPRDYHSNSSIKTWRRCPYQYRYKYVLGYKPKEKSIYLERGTWMHALLETHHSPFDDRTWRERHEGLAHEFYNLFEEEREELGELPDECERMMKSYIMCYHRDDEGVNVIDTEVDEIITLPNGLRFRMIIDKIIEEPDGGIWIVDYKNVGRFLPADFLLLDAQLARYFWGAEKLGYRPLRGIVYDEIITKPPTLPKILQNGKLERRANIKCDVYTYLRQIEALGQDFRDPYYRGFVKRLYDNRFDWFRRTRLPKDPPLTKRLMQELVWSAREIQTAEKYDAYPRTPMKDCQWDCSFIGPCTISLQGGDDQPLLDLRYTTREERDE
jgi:RecB family exonuclease